VPHGAIVVLLPCRVRWLPVLHWVFWVNTWHDRLYYKLLHGDKDTFALGFALAGHAAQYRQVRGSACRHDAGAQWCSSYWWLAVKGADCSDCFD
jgi:hypothetical protein